MNLIKLSKYIIYLENGEASNVLEDIELQIINNQLMPVNLEYLPKKSTEEKKA